MTDDITPGGFTDTDTQEITATADKIVDLRNRIASLSEEKESLQAELRERLKVADEPYVFGGRTITVAQTTIFSEEKARQIIAPEMIPMVEETVTSISAELCKELLAPVAYKACRVPRGKATVTVK